MKVFAEKDEVRDVTRIVVEATGLEWHLLGREAMAEAHHLMAKGIADEFLRTKGADVAANIPTTLVLNLAVAEVVKRLGEESRK